MSTKSKSASNEETTTVFDLDPTDLHSRVAKVSALADQIRALLPGLILYPNPDDRRSLHLRNGEADAMRSLMHAAGKHSQHFQALADKDRGSDPASFETTPTLAMLDRLEALSTLSATMSDLSLKITDTVTEMTSEVNEVTSPVLAIVRANQALDTSLATDAHDGLEFYGRMGRAAAQSRAKKKTTTTP